MCVKHILLRLWECSHIVNFAFWDLILYYKQWGKWSSLIIYEFHVFKSCTEVYKRFIYQSYIVVFTSLPIQRSNSLDNNKEFL